MDDMPSGGHNKIPRGDLIQGLLDLAEDLGKTPTRTEMNEHGPYSGSAYRREFGRWNAALEAVNFKKHRPSDPEYTTIECEQCGTTEHRLQSQIRNQKHIFCSVPCKNEWQATSWGGEDHPLYERIELKCVECGRPIPRKPSLVGEARDDQNVFCSPQCMGDARAGEGNPNFRGGDIRNYGPMWESQRLHRLELDRFRCRDCGMTNEESLDEYNLSLAVHHKVPFRTFYEDGTADYEAAHAIDNLVSLCASCHRKWEALPVQPRFGV